MAERPSPPPTLLPASKPRGPAAAPCPKSARHSSRAPRRLTRSRQRPHTREPSHAASTEHVSAESGVTCVSSRRRRRPCLNLSRADATAAAVPSPLSLKAEIAISRLEQWSGDRDALPPCSGGGARRRPQSRHARSSASSASQRAYGEGGPPGSDLGSKAAYCSSTLVM